eukprot:g7914.t1
MEAVLEKALQRRERLEGQSREYEELRANLQLLEDSGTEGFKSLVNLGCDFFMQAKVEDCSRVMVQLGAGVVAEMTHAEALRFIEAKQRALHISTQACAEECAALAAVIKAAMAPRPVSSTTNDVR